MRIISFVMWIGTMIIASIAMHQQAAWAADTPQSIYEPELQTEVNNILNQTFSQSLDQCYHGLHHGFNDELAARAFDALLKKAAEPDGICDQYSKHAAELPVTIAIPLLPGVAMDPEKLCKLIQHPRCPK